MAVGPATTVLRSSTRIPVSGGGKKLKIARVAKSRIMVAVPRVLGYIAWAIVALCAFGGLYFSRIAHSTYPSKYPEGLWELQRSLGAADVYLDTADGVRLHAWWVARPGARFVTLYLHGNAGSVTHRFRQIQEIAAAGSSILMLDYRGYWQEYGLADRERPLH